MPDRIRFPLPTGRLSRRITGAERTLRQLAESARRSARDAEEGGLHHLAASLRGKATAYTEAADIVAALGHGWRIPKRFGVRKPTDADHRTAMADLHVSPETRERIRRHFAAGLLSPDEIKRRGLDGGWSGT